MQYSTLAAQLPQRIVLASPVAAQLLNLCSGGSVTGWQVGTKPQWDILHLRRAVSGSSVPLPRAVLKLVSLISIATWKHLAAEHQAGWLAPVCGSTCAMCAVSSWLCLKACYQQMSVAPDQVC